MIDTKSIDNMAGLINPRKVNKSIGRQLCSGYVAIVFDVGIVAILKDSYRILNWLVIQQ
jgi:hypothetical protein